MNDMLYAVTHKDLNEMERLLDAGWTPPRQHAKYAGSYIDYSVWTEVIITDWVEGFSLLDKHFPQETAHSDVFELILRNAAISCLRHIWQRFEMSASQLTVEQKTLWVQALMGGMGEPWSAHHDVKEVLPVLKFLKEHDVNLNVLYPGEYQPKDLRMSGHSLWTRAVSVKRWDLLDELWPVDGSWASWPRLHEVIFHLIEVVVGDYKPLLPEKHGVLPEYTTLIRWLEDHGEAWALSAAPLSSWSGDIQALLGSDLASSDDKALVSMIDALAVPSPSRLSPWLRLPLHIRDDKDRMMVWNIWSSVLAGDMEKTWLRQLAFYPNDQDVLALLDLIKSDNVVSIQQAWRQPSSSGMSAAAQWAALTERVDPVFP